MAEFLIEDDILKKVWNIQKDEVVKIPDGVKVIGEKVFYQNREIKKVEIPDSVVCIAYRAFSLCKNLEEIEIPDSVTEIGRYAFSTCKNLRKVKLSRSLKRILERTFSWCENLEEIAIPDSVEIIADYAFNNCWSMTVLKIPDSVKYLGEGVFSRCLGLESVVISKSVNVIPSSCFQNCSELKEIMIPENVEIVEYDAFLNCKKLKKIIISDNLKKISPSAFFYTGAFRIEVQIDGEVKYFIPTGLDYQNLAKKNYDIHFNHFMDENTKIEAALLRLNLKYHLDEKQKKKYIEYLSRVFEKVMIFCIQNNRRDYFETCREFHLLNSENILTAIDYANQMQNVDMTAFLMNDQHEHFGNEFNLEL